MLMDYYLRVRMEQLQTLRFAHLVSELDHADNECAESCCTEGAALAKPITGLTEWTSDAQPAHSIGWDWVLKGADGQMGVQEHSVRTNIMLVDAQGVDLGRQQTETALLALIARLNWADQVLGTLQCIAR